MNSVETTIVLSRLASSYEVFDELMHHINTLKLTRPPHPDKKQTEKISLEEYGVHQVHVFATCNQTVVRVDLTVTVKSISVRVRRRFRRSSRCRCPNSCSEMRSTVPIRNRRDS